MRWKLNILFLLCGIVSYALVLAEDGENGEIVGRPTSVDVVGQVNRQDVNTNLNETLIEDSERGQPEDENIKSTLKGTFPQKYPTLF